MLNIRAKGMSQLKPMIIVFILLMALSVNFMPLASAVESDPENSEKIHKDFVSFMIFNIFLITVTVVLAIISNFNKMRKNPLIESEFVVKNVLPLVYFFFFSISMGGLLLLGVAEMEYYLDDKFHSDILDIGIIAGYTAALSISIANSIKKIVQNGLGSLIQGTIYHDIIGFILGRVVLLIILYFFI